MNSRAALGLSAGGVLFALAAVGGVALFAGLTTTISVANDTGRTVEVTGCGDPSVISAGGSAELEVNNYEASFCQVYNNAHVDEPAGCLVLSKEALARGGVKVRISEVDRARNSRCPD